MVRVLFVLQVFAPYTPRLGLAMPGGFEMTEEGSGAGEIVRRVEIGVLG